MEPDREAGSHEGLSQVLPAIRQEDQSWGVPQGFQDVRPVDVRLEDLGGEHLAVTR